MVRLRNRAWKGRKTRGMNNAKATQLARYLAMISCALFRLACVVHPEQGTSLVKLSFKKQSYNCFMPRLVNAGVQAVVPGGRQGPLMHPPASTQR